MEMDELSKIEKVSLDILRALIPVQKDMPYETTEDLVLLAVRMAKSLLKETGK